jgi:hypothetical protein
MFAFAAQPCAATLLSRQRSNRACAAEQKWSIGIRSDLPSTPSAPLIVDPCALEVRGPETSSPTLNHRARLVNTPASALWNAG